MWNIVTLSGKNYLVDVTNSDSGTAGQGGELFLAGRDGGSWNTQYNFNTEHNTLISYTYDADQKSLYGEDILTLAEKDYSPAGQEAQAQVNITGPENGKVPYGTAPELRVTVTGPEGSGIRSMSTAQRRQSAELTGQSSLHRSLDLAVIHITAWLYATGTRSPAVSLQ